MHIPMSSRSTSLLCALVAPILLAACVSNEPKKAAAEAPPTSAAALASTAPAAAPAPAAAAAAEAPPCVEDAAKGKAKKGQKGKPAATDCKDSPAAAAKQESPATARATDGAYDLTGNKAVTDSKTVESGQGKKVKGINDWEGEISGLPAANSPFKKLRIGMPMKQVTDLIGEPSDQGAYITGKAFIPFYFGSDTSRWETVYRNHGRLIFSSQAGFGGNWYLIWIIHNAKEGPYR